MSARCPPAPKLCQWDVRDVRSYPAELKNFVRRTSNQLQRCPLVWWSFFLSTTNMQEETEGALVISSLCQEHGESRTASSIKEECVHLEATMQLSRNHGACSWTMYKEMLTKTYARCGTLSLSVQMAPIIVDSFGQREVRDKMEAPARQTFFALFIREIQKLFLCQSFLRTLAVWGATKKGAHNFEHAMRQRGLVVRTFDEKQRKISSLFLVRQLSAKNTDPQFKAYKHCEKLTTTRFM